MYDRHIKILKNKKNLTLEHGKYWYVRYNIPRSKGKRKNIQIGTVGDDYQEVLQRYREAMQEKDSRLEFIGGLADAWLVSKVVRRPDERKMPKDGKIASSTYTNYKTMLTKDGRLMKTFGRWPISGITVQVLFEYLEGKFFPDNQDIPKIQLNREVQVMSQMLDYAVRKGIIQGNPAKSMGRGWKNAEGARNILVTEKDYNAVFKIQPVHIQIVMGIGRLTGLRIKDICGLRWEEDFLGDVAMRIYETKTGKLVKIPLSDGLKKVLKRSRLQGVISPYVVRDERGRPYIGDNGIVRLGKRFRAEVRRYNKRHRLFGNKMVGDNFLLKDLRKMYAQQVRDMRDIHEAQRALGHSSPDLTETHYVPDEGRSVVPLDLIVRR
jgi:integrase